MDKMWMWLAWRLPKRVVYWAAIRAGAHACGPKYPHQAVPELTLHELFTRWDDAA